MPTMNEPLRRYVNVEFLFILQLYPVTKPTSHVSVIRRVAVRVTLCHIVAVMLTQEAVYVIMTSTTTWEHVQLLPVSYANTL